MNAKLLAKCHYAFFVAMLLLLALPAHAFRSVEKGKREELAAEAKPSATPIRALSADQLTVAQMAEKAGISVEWHPRLGTPLWIRGLNLGQRQTYSGGKGLTFKGGAAYEQDAIAVLDNLSRFYGMSDAEQEFAVKHLEPDTLGFHHVRVTQKYRGCGCSVATSSCILTRVAGLIRSTVTTCQTSELKPIPR